MNVHAIGDAAARLVLDAYERHLSPGNDLRWRIEHAQLIHDADLPRFRALGRDPLGADDPRHFRHGLDRGPPRRRSDGPFPTATAISWNRMAGWPTAAIFPSRGSIRLRGFRAAAFRTDDRGLPLGGYRPTQAFSRFDAPARDDPFGRSRANFEENRRGSLEPGKLADFTVLDVDLLADPEERIREARVLATGINGAIAYDGR